MDRLRRFLLLTMVSLVFSLGSPRMLHSRQSPACDGCSLVQDALKASEELKPGLSRKDVEAQFTLEGGLQTARWSRYVFRRCPTIKIDVRFTSAEAGQGAEMLPTDQVLGVSRPYLDFSIAD